MTIHRIDAALPIAFADLGDGTAHDPQIRFHAPDTSAIWNDFPILISARAFTGGALSSPQPSEEVFNSWHIPGPAGGSPDPDGWPPLLLRDYLNGYLSGATLELRLRFHYTSAQLFVNVKVLGSGVFSVSGLPGGPHDYDSGWVAVPDLGCAGRSQVLPFQAGFATDDTFGTEITDGILELRWVGSGTPATYDPQQPFLFIYAPPIPKSLRDDQTTTLDPFLRADTASPPSDDWTNLIDGAGSGLADTNPGVRSLGATGTAWWNATRFSRNQEAWALVSTWPGSGDGVLLFCRLKNMGSSAVTGFAARILPTGETAIYSIAGSTWTRIDTGGADAVPAADWTYYLRAVEDRLGILVLPPDASLPTEINSTPSIAGSRRGGYIGLGLEGTSGRVGIFGGGNYFRPPGLEVKLEVNSCGVLTKTYNQIATAIGLDAAIPVKATINHNGTDLAKPDSGLLEGAVMSAATSPTSLGIT